MSNSVTELSVNEFTKIVKDEVRQICEEKKWNFDTNVYRGYAFQIWCARLINQAESSFDTDPEDAVNTSVDLKADLIFEDTNASHQLIAQCKYDGFEKNTDETEVNDFFRRHELFMNKEWIQRHGSDAVQLLSDYAENIKNEWTVSYYFITTTSATERTHEAVDAINRYYEAQKIKISCKLFDFSALKEYYIMARSYDEAVPDTVEIDLPAKKYFEKVDPYKTIIASVKGNMLRGLYRKYRQRLYAFNIRGYLGNRGINNQIYLTAKDDPDKFFYFNNGVSAICTNYELDNNHLKVTNLQIINGAQTLSSLANADDDSKIDVLFRLTKTENVKTEKGFNQKIIQYNNSQNQVKISDFRANDDIQYYLENAFKNWKPRKGPLPPLVYVRKRGLFKRGIGQLVRFEDFIKIRYSFLYEPTRISEAPKSLWTLRENGGVYEDAIGVDGRNEPAWSEEVLHQALLAIAFYNKIDEGSKAIISKKADLKFIKRLRYHATALAGIYCRKDKKINASDLIYHDDKFMKIWEKFWPVAADVLVNSFTIASATDKSSLHAFIRSNERWELIKTQFDNKIAVVSSLS